MTDALDLELTAYWWPWRYRLFADDAVDVPRTCRKGHDWATYRITFRSHGKTHERCGECNRIASRRAKTSARAA